MAAKVSLLSEDGRKSEKVKRCAAEYLVRVLLAAKISDYIYQRLAVKSVEQHKLESQRYIPSTLPPAEGHGLKYQSPEKDLGKLKLFRFRLLEARQIARQSL